MKSQIYDNSNIAESYAGVTTPLTFSFVRQIYEKAYQHFCSLMGASPQTITENKMMFHNMVEFVGYRIYYNLTNWYKMISFFPGYKFSRRFMEQMMGVEEEFNQQVEYKSGFLQRYLIYLPVSLFQAIKIITVFSFMGLSVKRFNRYFDKTLNKFNGISLSRLSEKELASLYKTLDNKLVSRWRTPIANDFAVMVSTGLVSAHFRKWFQSDSGHLYIRTAINAPLISLDPGHQVSCIVQRIKKEEEIYTAFVTTDRTDVELFNWLGSKHKDSDTTKTIRSYLDIFGLRAPSELKLESETFQERPEVFISLIRNTLRAGECDVVKKEDYAEFVFPHDTGVLKKFYIRWLLKWAGNSIHRREETRFRRTLIFGFTRRIFLAWGEKFAEQGFIVEPRDIFYLKIEEIFSSVDDSSMKVNFKNEIIQRKQELKEWGDIELPRRIVTSRSMREVENTLMEKGAHETFRGEGLFTGLVVSCPKDTTSIVGEALTLKEFNPDANFQNKILITTHTDPGWTMVFPLVKAIVVERGGMLSHAAIVARELNIPCVIGVNGATRGIKTGTRVQLNLQRGEVLQLI